MGRSLVAIGALMVLLALCGCAARLPSARQVRTVIPPECQQRITYSEQTRCTDIGHGWADCAGRFRVLANCIKVTSK